MIMATIYTSNGNLLHHPCALAILPYTAMHHKMYICAFCKTVDFCISHRKNIHQDHLQNSRCCCRPFRISIRLQRQYLDFLQKKAKNRKLRLFDVSVCHYALSMKRVGSFDCLHSSFLLRRHVALHGFLLAESHGKLSHEDLHFFLSFFFFLQGSFFFFLQGSFFFLHGSSFLHGSFFFFFFLHGSCFLHGSFFFFFFFLHGSSFFFLQGSFFFFFLQGSSFFFLHGSFFFLELLFDLLQGGGTTKVIFCLPQDESFFFFLSFFLHGSFFFDFFDGLQDFFTVLQEYDGILPQPPLEPCFFFFFFFDFFFTPNFLQSPPPLPLFLVAKFLTPIVLNRWSFVTFLKSGFLNFEPNN